MAVDADRIIEEARRLLEEEQPPEIANPCQLAQLPLPRSLKRLYQAMCQENPEETIALAEFLAREKQIEALVRPHA